MANDLTLRFAIFSGAALAVVAASEVTPAEWRMVAGALAAGFGALVGLLRPPSGPSPRPPFGGGQQRG